MQVNLGGGETHDDDPDPVVLHGQTHDTQNQKHLLQQEANKAKRTREDLRLHVVTSPSSRSVPKAAALAKSRRGEEDMTRSKARKNAKSIINEGSSASERTSKALKMSVSGSASTGARRTLTFDAKIMPNHASRGQVDTSSSSSVKTVNGYEVRSVHSKRQAQDEDERRRVASKTTTGEDQEVPPPVVSHLNKQVAAAQQEGYFNKAEKNFPRDWWKKKKTASSSGQKKAPRPKVRQILQRRGQVQVTTTKNKSPHKAAGNKSHKAARKLQFGVGRGHVVEDESNSKLKNIEQQEGALGEDVDYDEGLDAEEEEEDELNEQVNNAWRQLHISSGTSEQEEDIQVLQRGKSSSTAHAHQAYPEDEDEDIDETKNAWHDNLGDDGRPKSSSSRTPEVEQEGMQVLQRQHSGSAAAMKDDDEDNFSIKRADVDGDQYTGNTPVVGPAMGSFGSGTGAAGGGGGAASAGSGGAVGDTQATGNGAYPAWMVPFMTVSNRTAQPSGISYLDGYLFVAIKSPLNNSYIYVYAPEVDRRFEAAIAFIETRKPEFMAFPESGLLMGKPPLRKVNGAEDATSIDEKVWRFLFQPPEAPGKVEEKEEEEVVYGEDAEEEVVEEEEQILPEGPAATFEDPKGMGFPDLEFNISDHSAQVQKLTEEITDRARYRTDIEYNESKNNGGSNGTTSKDESTTGAPAAHLAFLLAKRKKWREERMLRGMNEAVLLRTGASSASSRSIEADMEEDEDEQDEPLAATSSVGINGASTPLEQQTYNMQHQMVQEQLQDIERINDHLSRTSTFTTPFLEENLDSIASQPLEDQEKLVFNLVMPSTQVQDLHHQGLGHERHERPGTTSRSRTSLLDENTEEASHWSGGQHTMPRRTKSFSWYPSASSKKATHIAEADTSDNILSFLEREKSTSSRRRKSTSTRSTTRTRGPNTGFRRDPIGVFKLTEPVSGIAATRKGLKTFAIYAVSGFNLLRFDIDLRKPLEVSCPVDPEVEEEEEEDIF
ncbi:unnamed protein product [Amoebophrya sp. A25]|nr:unnamed protein product [Amoebophrya sp. A25]|eukprot:GSA25T00008654001.1